MYNRKIYTAGNTIEIEDMFSSSKGKKCKRNNKENITPEKVQKYNLKLAEDELRRIVNANFFWKDLHVIFTYDKKKRPTPQQAKKNIERLFDKLRYRFKKQKKKFRYVYISGYIDKDEEDEENQFVKDHKEENIHHHVIMAYYDIAELVELWEHGGICAYPLDNRGDYTQLANYFIRHTKNSFRNKASPSKQMYSCSRGLLRPKPKIKKVNAESWRKEPVPMKGYYIDRDSVKYGVSEITGYPYRFYRMIRAVPIPLLE